MNLIIDERMITILKKVLIVGASSYIGDSLNQYAQNRLDIDTVATLNDEWKQLDFSGYDSIVNVAGVAHRSQKEVGGDIYFKVNCDLAVNIAKKAKDAGIGQYVYLSSLYAYGARSGQIDKTTQLNPTDYYGRSKYQSEQLLTGLIDNSFKLAILRPPMVYGPNSKGNFPQLVKVAKTLPFFPNINNKRSMIYIDNLCECIIRIIEKNVDGIFCPQNKEYTNTCDMLVSVSATQGKKKLKVNIFTPFVKLGMPLLSPLQTAFGSLYYDKDLDCTDLLGEYRVVKFEESIRKSVM